jgi:uncharacterized protein YeaO (DUF488 family)
MKKQLPRMAKESWSRGSGQGWLKEVAPTSELRKWYSHDPAKWIEFKKRYWKELDEKKGIVERLAKESKGRKVTFVFGSREEKFNNATALKEYIARKIK